MKPICVALLYFLFAIQQNGAGQHSRSVIVMDFVKIKNGKKAEALFFYESNWKLYRDEAMKRNFIESYQLMEALPDSLNNFDLVLITVYKDSIQHQDSEKNFAPILKDLRPNGPALLNDLKPADFRQNVFMKITRPIFLQGKKK